MKSRLVLLLALSCAPTHVFAQPAPRATNAKPKPDPQLTPAKGELRLDGRVTAITGTNSFTMSAISFTAPSGNTREFEEAVSKRVTMTKTAIVRAADVGRARKFSELKLGARVAIVGKSVGGGVQARSVVLLDVRKLETARAVVVTPGVAMMVSAGKAALDAGQTARAMKLLQGGVQAARNAGDRRGEVLARTYVGLAHSTGNAHAEALKEYARALQIARELDDPAAQGLVLLNMASVQIQLEQREEAFKSLEQSIAFAREGGDPKVRLISLVSFGDALLRRDQLPATLTRASALYEEALPIARDSNDDAREADLLSSLALVRLLQGNADETRDYTKRAEAMLPNLSDPLTRGALLETLASIYGRGTLRNLNTRRDYLTQAVTAYQTANQPKLAERAQKRLDTAPADDLPFPDEPETPANPNAPTNNANNANNGVPNEDGTMNDGAMNGGMNNEGMNNGGMMNGN